MPAITRRSFHKLLGSAAVAQTVFNPWASFAETPDQDALCALTLTEASHRIATGAVTPTQLVQALLDRIQVMNPKINCYITVMAQEALDQARVLEAEQKAGKLRGPLHGIPLALKDNIDTAGVRTTAASPMFKDRVPTEDADVVVKLKSAGAIILGKLNLHEFAMGCTGDVSYFGPTRNPWALDHVTGGSSSGSGAAVVADLCFGALGTDTGGSIRVPSSWCGIVGLKPTFGLVSIRGIIPCLASLDHCGPMARTVEDVALMLGPMAGYDNLDIYSRPSTEQDYLAQMRQPVSGFRLGTPQSYFDHLEPDVEARVTEALGTLTKLTAGVVSHASLPEIAIGGPGALGDADAYHLDLIRDHGLTYMPPDRARFEHLINPPPGSHIQTSGESAAAHQRLELLRRTVDSAFSNFDLVVVPTVRGVAPTITDSLTYETTPPDHNPKMYDWFQGSLGCSNTSPFDAYGLPAISIPCGFAANGMPVGLMIAGPHFAEGKVLALAYAFQQATQFHTRRPVLTAKTIVPPLVERKEPTDNK